MTCHDSYPTVPSDERQPESDRRPIVVGVDGSESSRKALLWAQSMATSTGGFVEAITVWQPVPGYAWAGAGWGAAPGDWNPAPAAEKLLTETVDQVFGSDRPANLVLTVAEGSAAEVLIRHGATADMLVVGCRGHGGFVGMLIGSVSAACAEHATCPVLVIHGNRKPQPAADSSSTSTSTSRHASSSVGRSPK